MGNRPILSKQTGVLDAWGRIDGLQPAPTSAVDSVNLARAQLNPRLGIVRTNPVTRPLPGLIRRSTPVGSMGSCFSTRIMDWLTKNGFNYVCAEPEARPLDESVFRGGWVRHSARFGHVYNTACARQILDRALGRFSPCERAWKVDYMGEPVLRDPYRCGIAWLHEQEMHEELAAHNDAVLRAVRTCEVFIVTAGLSEIWKSKRDGSVFASVPPAGVHDPDRHAFELSSVEENIQNLEGMYASLREINPGVRLVLALSPVRLKATYRKVHWAVGNAVSKSVLRVAIDRFCEFHPEVIYFPSYEIVTGMLTEDAYEPDAEHLKLKHVERVMISFMSAYGDPDELRTIFGGRTIEEAGSIEYDERDRIAARELETPAALHFFRDFWSGLGQRFGDVPIVLVGAGLHTERLAFAVGSVPGPRVLAVLDDAPKRTHIGDWPVRRFDEVSPAEVCAAVISSDTIVPVLTQQAKSWIGDHGVRIETLYAEEPDDRGGVIEWAHAKHHERRVV